jgi:hypothetical protein
MILLGTNFVVFSTKKMENIKIFFPNVNLTNFVRKLHQIFGITKMGEKIFNNLMYIKKFDC